MIGDGCWLQRLHRDSQRAQRKTLNKGFTRRFWCPFGLEPLAPELAAEGITAETLRDFVAELLRIDDFRLTMVNGRFDFTWPSEATYHPY